MLGLTDEGEGVLLLHLRSPEFPVGGAPNLRCPVSVHVGPDGLEAAKALVTAINADLLELRRVPPADLLPTPPAAVPSPQGPRRPDVDAAAGRMRVADGGSGLELNARGRDDLDRVAAAVRHACQLQRAVGAIAPRSPSAADLFTEWQTLLERRQLGMVTDEEFERQAVGLLLAVSGN
jgi:hypothetical protein